jgi:hypothetical protein
MRFALKRPHHSRITRVAVYVDGRRVLTRRGRSLRQVSLRGLRGRHRIRIDEYAGRRRVARLRRTTAFCTRGRR